MTTTAKIAAKGTSGTGITEDLAQTLHNQLGRKVIAIVEMVAETRSEKRNGDEAVVLSILTVEPAPTSTTEDHLRELARSFYYERQLADGQLKLDGSDDIEPKVADVLAAGAAHKPHPYLTSQLAVDDSENGPVCDICGQVETAGVHQASLPGVTDPFAVPDDEPDDAEPEVDEDDPWDNGDAEHLDHEDTDDDQDDDKFPTCPSCGATGPTCKRPNGDTAPAWHAARRALNAGPHLTPVN